MDFDRLLDKIKNLFQPKKADPEKVRRENIKSRGFFISAKTAIAAFVVLIVLVASVSVITVVREKSKEKKEALLLSGESINEAAFLKDSAQNNLGGNVLVALSKSDNEKLRLLAVINVNGETGRMKMLFIPVNVRCSVRGYESDMNGHLENGGITELLWAVGEKYSIAIDKYFCCDDEDFMNLGKRIGSVEMNVDEKVSYEYEGINFIIEEGTQAFTADNLLKYIVYMSETLEKNSQKLANVIGVLSRQILTGKDADKTPEQMYNRVINYLQTNLTAIDVTNNLAAIYNLLSAGALSSIEVVHSTESFE